jgi:hypothetical protein
MDANRMPTVLQLQAEKRRNGLFFGMLAGVGFSLGVWGLDTYLLWRAAADLPWVKLAVGLPFCVLIGAAAGWLAARFDHGLLAAGLWVLAGLGFVWTASHTPFEGASFLIGLLEPHLRGLAIYPFTQSAQARMSLLYIVVGLLAAIAGALQMSVVESATRSSHQSVRWFNLVMAGLILLAPLGLMADNLINQPLRQPVTSVNQLIQFGRQAQVTPVTREQARVMGLSALRPFGDLIHQPYRLILGHYDPESITDTVVYVDFKGVWGACFVIAGTPTFCQLSQERYADRSACLLNGGTGEACLVRTSGTANLPELIQQIGAQPDVEIYDQHGTAVVLKVSSSARGEFLCYLRVTGDIFFEDCQPASDRLTSRILPRSFAPAASYIPSPFPVSQVDPGELDAWLLDTQPLNVELAYSALLPSARQGLPGLSSAPRYSIRLTIDFHEHRFHGQARLEYTNTEEVSLGELYFRLLPNGGRSYGNGSLTVNRVLLNGQPAQTALSHDDTVLRVDMPRMLMGGAKVLLAFDFTGQVPLDFGGQATPAGYGIYNFSDDVMALASWYPILAVYDRDGWNLDAVSEIGDSVYSDIAFYAVEIHLPEQVEVVATGTEITRQVVDGWADLSYQSGPARDFFLVASPHFEKLSREVDGVQVNSFYLPGGKAGGQAALSVAADSLRIFNERFGQYPYNELDVVAAPMRNALGVEFPGIVLIGESLYAAPDKPEFSTTVAHEVAHQWWYNLVGNDVFDEPWLDEALTTYSSSLYYEFALGPQHKDGLVAYWQERYDRLLQDGNDDWVAKDLAYFESLNNPRVYGGVVYVKGALFFDALRQRIGDEAFFGALREYYRAHRFRIARGEDLLNAFRRASRTSLDAFFEVWLYSKR